MSLAKSMTWDDICKRICYKSGLLDNKFYEWLLTKESLGYLLNPLTYRHLYAISKKLKRNRDHFTVVTGKEGVGKSTLGLQGCAIVSPTFKLSQICTHLDDFIKAIKMSKPGDSILIDEGSLFLFSREAMMEETRTIIKMFTILRAKNLHICICIPNFFIIDSYVREHRVDTLINITETSKFQVYTKSALKVISKEGSKHKYISSIRVPDGTSWRGYHNKTIPVINDINEAEYTKIKNHAVNRFIKELEDLVRVKAERTSYMTISDVARALPITARTVRRHIISGKLQGEKFGSKYLVHKDTLAEYIKNENWVEKSDLSA